MVGALYFLVKACPIRLLPLITGSVVDIVGSHGSVRGLWLDCGLLAVVLTLNYPTQILYTRCDSPAIRRISNSLRLELCIRLQELSIGFHAGLRAENSAFRTEMEQFSSRVLELITLIPITRGHALEDSAVQRMNDAVFRVRTSGAAAALIAGKFRALS